MEDNQSKLMNEEEICTCYCHIKGFEILHFTPCCQYTYKKYINEDRSIDYDEYNKIR